MARKGNHVKIRNRKTGGVWECPAKVVDEFLSNGWQKAAESAEPTNEASTQVAPSKER